ncbi:unnamed protein product [Zymoseptoria tritici ST99CH_3D7]|uniref:Uncharacterized protein n=2 Tax=Zymoseptoria tritici TaxID=1047171 RepID=A0A1X7RH40_ZYMT9|nr:unnamed protein product [Zymoseptoria tritici ST99CH_3D7]SMR43080.1 unnamed protein product [Zymoseptoria tritici ST99CH_1E4]
MQRNPSFKLTRPNQLPRNEQSRIESQPIPQLPATDVDGDSSDPAKVHTPAKRPVFKRFKRVSTVVPESRPSQLVTTGLFQTGEIADDFADCESIHAPEPKRWKGSPTVLVEDETADVDLLVSNSSAFPSASESPDIDAVACDSNGKTPAVQTLDPTGLIESSQQKSSFSLSNEPTIADQAESSNAQAQEIAEPQLASIEDDEAAAFDRPGDAKRHQIRDCQRNVCPICQVDWTDPQGKTKKAEVAWRPCTLPGFSSTLYIDEHCHNSWHHTDGKSKNHFGDTVEGAVKFANHKRESTEKGSHAMAREERIRQISDAQGSLSCPTCPEKKAGETVAKWADCNVPGLKTLPGFSFICRPCYQSWYGVSKKADNALVAAKEWCRKRNEQCRRIAETDLMVEEASDSAS